MLRTPIILGISMAPRKSRRLLVAFTYAVMLALMATVIIVFPSGRPQMDALWFCVLPLAYNIVSRAIFGRLVKDTVLPEIHGGEMTSLGLTHRRRDEDEPDEREVAVRNSAYFSAYRALALYSIALWAAWPLFLRMRTSTAAPVLLMLTMPLLAMALTLPQAVVLWSEPDVPEEARI